MLSFLLSLMFIVQLLGIAIQITGGLAILVLIPLATVFLIKKMRGK